MAENVPPKKNMCMTVIRKSVTTLIHDNQEEDAQPLADLLAHDLVTAKRVYRMRNRERQAVRGTNAISKALHVTEPHDQTVNADKHALYTSPQRLRKPWTDAQNVEINAVFSEEIQKKVITIDIVREKLSLISFEKNDKQIYDKLRTIIRMNTFLPDIAQLPHEVETLSEKINRIAPTPENAENLPTTDKEVHTVLVSGM